MMACYSTRIPITKYLGLKAKATESYDLPALQVNARDLSEEPDSLRSMKERL